MIASADFEFAGLFVVLVLGVLIFLVFSLAKDTSRDDLLEKIARGLGGRSVKGGFLEESSIRYAIDGREASLQFHTGSKHAPTYSRVVVDLRGQAPGILHILEEGFGQSFLKLFGAQDLSVGDPDFDKDYVIKAVPESVATRVFSPERRGDVIRAVRSLRGYASPTFDVENQDLTVSVREYLDDEARIQKLAKAASDFARLLLPPTGSPGIALGEVRIRPEGACPVCESALGDGAPRCALCDTPQHAECWEYLGRCSTYACRGHRAPNS